MLTHCKKLKTLFIVKPTPLTVKSMIYVAWILIHCTNIAIPCKINYICIAFILSSCKNTATHYQIDDICTEAPGGAGGPPEPSESKVWQINF